MFTRIVEHVGLGRGRPVSRLEREILNIILPYVEDDSLADDIVTDIMGRLYPEPARLVRENPPEPRFRI